MANLRVMHENWLDDITLTVTSEEGDFTKDRMQMPVAKDVWRATSAAIQQISGDLGASKSIGGLHLEGINFSDAAVITIELSTVSNFASHVYAATFAKWADDLVLKSATHWFDDAGGQNRTISTGATRTTSTGATRTLRANTTGIQTAQHVRISVDDPNNGDGYVEIGRLVLGNYFDSLETNARYGYRLGYVEMSQSSRSRGGSLRSENEDPFRVQSFEWAFLTDHQDELYELMDRLWRNRGVRNDIVVSAFPEDSDAKVERLHTVLGRITNADAAEYYVNAYRNVPGSTGRIYRARFTVEETL